MTSADNAGRTVFFDNLRSLMVVLVLIFHSGASYGSGVEFWPFHDKDPSKIIDIFMFLCDVFMMAILFFIAGYFTLPDLRRKGTWRFIKGKLKRLGMPWLVITLIVLPALDYIHYFFYQAGYVLHALSFPEYWALSMKKIAEFYTGWIDMSAYWSMTEKFYQRYMWFLSLLLFFFVAFALLHKIKSHINRKSDRQNSNPANLKRNVFKALFVTSLIMIIFFGLVRFMIYPEFMAFGWFSLGNILQFQFGKLIVYICCFCMGIYSFSRKWFTGNADFGKPWVWAIICFCFFGLNMLALKNLSSSEAPLVSAKIAFCVFYPLLSLSFLGFFVSWTYKHWNRQTKFNMNLAESSYNMYLVHYIVPFTLPLLLSCLNMPVIFKFSIVSIATILFSYTVSRFVVKPLSKA
jgi:glucans biosynthesis protein C